MVTAQQPRDDSSIAPAATRLRRDPPAVRRLPIVELIGLCHAEHAGFPAQEPSCEEYGMELMRRAVCERDQGARTAVVAQYHGLVLAWVKEHPAAATVREDEEYWANRAFERFWQAVGPERFGAFPSLAALLRYLKMCAHGVLLDAVRRQAALPSESLSADVDAGVEAPAMADVADGELAARELWRAIGAAAQGAAERRVAYLCLALALKPRDVYARCPDQFASVADVYRVKRNLLTRLCRSPEIEAFLG